MSIIVEINQMRNNMGLNPINESDILNESKPLMGIAKLIDDIIFGYKICFIQKNVYIPTLIDFIIGFLNTG
jgi:hypothetical protein